SWRRVIGELEDMGLAVIGFTGGEPVLRRDLAELIGSVREATTLLFTSGDGLTPGKALELKKAGLFGTAVSLDHFRPEEHNRKRGRADAYDVAVSAIRNARHAGLYTMMQLVATHDMCEEGCFDNYLRLAEELAVHEIRLLEPMPSGKLLAGGHDAGLTQGQRATLRDVHVRTNGTRNMPKVTSFAYIEDAGQFGCGAGFQHLYVDFAGNVTPCDFTPVSFGNVEEEPTAAIWDRLHSAFNRPRRTCFLVDNAAALGELHGGSLPLAYDEARTACRFCREGLPEYYHRIGAAGALEPVKLPASPQFRRSAAA
ncbi:radical SAM/SPASM domain-containing protein, partial [Verrucomicrobiota bacterium]